MCSNKGLKPIRLSPLSLADRNILFESGGIELLVIEIIKQVVIILLTTVQFAMLARAILSWFPIDNRFVDFLHAITEPFIIPVRMLFEKMNWFSGLPIDMSFFVTYILLSVILIFLP